MRFDVKKPRNTEMVLQITSMADCFIIILVFLLKSVATGALNVSPSQGLVLPQAATPHQPEQALTVEISSKGIQVDNEFVGALERFRFRTAELNDSGVPSALNHVLENQRKRQDFISQTNPDVKSDNKILVLADEKTPYITLKAVLAAAAINGFTEFKLLVAKKE